MENDKTVVPVCVVLAAGRGTRMRSKTTHKVCFSVAGRPAILRAIDAYRQAGIESFVVVVGSMADQVMDTVGGEFPDVTFAYQATQGGTGHATRVGVTPLEKLGSKHPIFVTMGDKLIDPEAVKTLLATFENDNLDAAVAVLPKEEESSGGTVLLRIDGSFAGIVEQRDIQKAAILEAAHHAMAGSQSETAAALESVASLAEETIPDSEKRRLALGAIADALENHDIAELQAALEQEGPDARYISLGSDRFTPVEASASKLQNAALYLFRAEALYEALDWISADNAQKEEYLTDAVNYLANKGTVDGQRTRVGHCILDPAQILTYNNPEELIAVEEIYRHLHNIGQTDPESRFRALPNETFRTVREWLSCLELDNPELRTAFESTYGIDTDLWSERVGAYRRALLRFGELHGFERNAILVRSPGRINLMGRHIEHRGGMVNVMAINKEVIAVAAPRNDDVVTIANVDPVRYPEADFRIGEEIANVVWDDWLTYINHERVQALVRNSKGSWANYVKAALLRLQFQFRNTRIYGMDVVYDGNIPEAAGLSSSSAIVVASAEAAVALNGLDVVPQDFVDLCGEGEWYVGSRGGAGDHAAMKFGQPGQVTQIGFFPFHVSGRVPFSDDYRLVIANSQIKAQKMTNAKDTFNQRVASYEFGLMLLKESFPNLAPKMPRLRDFSPGTLGVLPSQFYRMLGTLPEELTPSEIRELLGHNYENELDRIFSSHSLPDRYLIRSVVLYGAAECQRAAMCRQLLEQVRVEDLGRLMQISHDGDRVVRYSNVNGGWGANPYDYSASDTYLRQLLDDLKSEDPDRVRSAQVFMQPGGYACSTPEIDEMVDLSLSVPGVIGAQLSGAGLGGCIMVLLRSDAVRDLEKCLVERFYTPRGLSPDITVSSPVLGSGLVSVG